MRQLWAPLGLKRLSFEMTVTFSEFTTCVCTRAVQAASVYTTTDRPLARFVTRTQVPSSSDG